MLDLETLQKIDKQKMFEAYDNWPTIAEDAYNSEHEKIDFAGIDHIVLAGMGGSGAIGDFFASILSKANIHVSVIKGYLLPNTINENTLIITTSVSGNTIETLTILKNAMKTNAKIIAFSDGGEMKKICRDNKIIHRNLKSHHSPRGSFTSFLYSMLKILSPILPIKKNDVVESIIELKKLQKNISSKNINKENSSLNLANWITGIPVIYYPWGLEASAIRFKNSLQENVKMHCMVEDIIESCHNGIVSWEIPQNMNPILLQGDDDYIKTKERWKIIKEYFVDNGIEFKEIYSVKGNIISKLINLIYLLDYSSIYLAAIRGIDPSPVKSIDFVKKKL
jgi:glucose/mannose-6-phosphate isomerase